MSNNSSKKIFYSNYQASKIAIKKAKKIFADLIEENKKIKICKNCQQTNFNFSLKKDFFECSNIECSHKSIVFRPLHNCQLNYAKIEILLCMIIDMQQINEIHAKIHINKQQIKKWRNRFLEQINWSKYKLDKDILDIREVYASINWNWIQK